MSSASSAAVGAISSSCSLWWRTAETTCVVGAHGQALSEAHKALRGEMTEAEKLIVYLKSELYGVGGKVKRLEAELAAERATAESLRYCAHARAVKQRRVHLRAE